MQANDYNILVNQGELFGRITRASFARESLEKTSFHSWNLLRNLYKVFHFKSQFSAGFCTQFHKTVSDNAFGRRPIW